MEMGVNIDQGQASLLDLIWNRSHIKTPHIFFYQNFKCYESWTYSQLWVAAQKFSSCLADLPAHTPVLISLPNGPEFFPAFFGCQMNGLLPAPIVSPDVWGRADYLNYVSQLSERNGIKNIICDEKVASSLRELGLNAIVFGDVWAKLSSTVIIPERPNKYSETALLQFSSGSTSDSKGVLLTHRQILNNLQMITEGMAPYNPQVIATWLPFYHDMGLIGGFLTPMFQDVPVHVSKPADFASDSLGWLNHVCEVEAGIMVGPDFMYKLLARQVKGKAFKGDLSRLKICMTGAEPVLASTCEDFTATFAANGLDPNCMMPVYGMAENVLAVTFSKFLSPLKFHTIETSKTKWVSCGRPLEGVKLQIRSGEDGKLLPENQVGEIFLQSPSRTSGFYNRPDFNKELIVDDWLKTGDLGFIKDGELYVTGRSKDLVIVRGRKIYGIDIEAKVYEKWKQSISRVAVVMSNETVTNQSLIVAVEVRNWFTNKVEAAAVKRFLSSFMSDVEFNVFILPKKSLPRTSSGKLKRYQIREWAASGKLEKLSKSGARHILRSSIQAADFIIRFLVDRWRGPRSLNVDPVHFDGRAEAPSHAIDKSTKAS